MAGESSGAPVTRLELREELKRFATKAELRKELKRFATKDALAKIAALTRQNSEAIARNSEAISENTRSIRLVTSAVNKIQDRLDHIEAKMSTKDQLSNYASLVDRLAVEYSSVWNKQIVHDERLRALEEKTGKHDERLTALEQDPTS